MKLIGAGLPRTATLSQKIALELLGVGPCYHMVDVLGDLARAREWSDALDGNPRWDEIFAGYDSTVDWSGSYYYRELREAYPDAKLLLSVRSPESWARSMTEGDDGSPIQMRIPPSTAREAPVTKPEAPEQRKTTGPATSSGSPKRPSGVASSMRRRPSSGMASVRRVRM